MLLFLSVHLLHAIAWIYGTFVDLVLRPSSIPNIGALLATWRVSRDMATGMVKVYGLSEWASLLVETTLWVTLAVAVSQRRQR